MARVLEPGGRMVLADLLNGAIWPSRPRQLRRRQPYAAASAALFAADLGLGHATACTTPFGPYFISVATKTVPKG